jgi:pimeloyl-ACP methyl ester carboxylesterase
MRQGDVAKGYVLVHLTGLGERSHLVGAHVDLSTRATDVVNVLKWERLSDVTLCGHSYGGFVISGVAEAMPEAIASLIFVDPLVPENGDTVAAAGSAPTRARIGEAHGARQPWRRRRRRSSGSTRRTAPGSRRHPHPATRDHRRTRAHPRKTYIRARGYAAPAFDGMLAKVRAMTRWRIFELDCGHDVMVDMPDVLAQILLQAA